MFNLAPDADRKTTTAASRQLASQLAEALELCIAQHVEAVRQQTPFPEAPAAGIPAIYFQPNEVLANAGYPGEQQFQFPYDKMAYIRLFPTYQSARIGRAKLVPIFEARKPCPMTMIIGGIPGLNRFGPIIFDPRGLNTINGPYARLRDRRTMGSQRNHIRPACSPRFSPKLPRNPRLCDPYDHVGKAICSCSD